MSKRPNPPPKLALTPAGQSDDAVLTTPDIQGTVTTPGMIEMLGRNSNGTFNQFSLAPITSNVGNPTQTIPSISHSPQTVQYSTIEPSIKREPSEDKNYVELDTPQRIPNVQQMHSNQVTAVTHVPNMPTTVVPVNMDEQERQKLERKRERNRLAATKCRQRKIQKINVLEAEVQVLTERNNNLKNERRHLREELQRLETQLGIPPQQAQLYA